MKILKRLLDCHLVIPLPMLGCGVLGMALIKSSKRLGDYAACLLRSLEYRGFDSTGGAFQDDNKKITLLKDVGAPSVLVNTLGIKNQIGKLFCGQVRWATFGSVDKVNSQPHVVECKRHIYGAHNGNITNTRELKSFLSSEGHNVLSDNDGEIVVHMVEHYFDIELNAFSAKEQLQKNIRKECMQRAIIRANSRLIGSFAAIIIDPQNELVYAIKAGSSLYLGTGEVDGDRFILASSDLTAILRFTKDLIDIKEGEFAEFDGADFCLFAYKNKTEKQKNGEFITYKSGQTIDRIPTRSKLRAEDTELAPEYTYFMEQEIQAEADSTQKLITLFTGGSETMRYLLDFLENENLLEDFKGLHQQILQAPTFEAQRQSFERYYQSKESDIFYDLLQERYEPLYDEVIKGDFTKRYFFSNDKNLIIDLVGEQFNKKKLLIAKVLDAISEIADVAAFEESMSCFSDLMKNCIEKRRNIYVIACGSSFHAALIGGQFFNEIAGTEIHPVLPGDFRGRYNSCLRDDDVIIGVSQSGETKDLIDIFNDIDQLNLNIRKIVLVNNLNSTLGQEKSDISIPVFCGPEMAIPATKSFINQLTVFYFLAIKTLASKIKLKERDVEDVAILERSLRRRLKGLDDIPLLIKETIATSEEAVERIASRIFLAPSMHLMATKISGVAKEGALKIRETLLNHAEGGEASEFKHGPNTILGKNTVLGIDNVNSTLKGYTRVVEAALEQACSRNILPEDAKKLITALGNYVFDRTLPFNLAKKSMMLFNEIIEQHDFFEDLFSNYPLIYITGPGERDVNLTISQINTHKIRGADTFVLAEENEKLLQNASYVPNKNAQYSWDYLKLPKTDDALMTTFSATVALQLLALRMSIKKMNYLNKLQLDGHGVHPDIPKNVSKSITVD